MKKIIIVIVSFFFTSNLLQAQCKPIDLNTLQAIQNLPPEKKETKILDLGFELKAGQTATSTTKSYVKCHGEGGKKDYYQTLTVNAEMNTVGFSTYGKKNYLSMRKAIEDSPNYKFSHKLPDGADQFESKSYKISFLVNGSGYSVSIGNLLD